MTDDQISPRHATFSYYIPNKKKIAYLSISVEEYSCLFLPVSLFLGSDGFEAFEVIVYFKVKSFYGAYGADIYT